jgi:hypothetical protein
MGMRCLALLLFCFLHFVGFASSFLAHGPTIAIQHQKSLNTGLKQAPGQECMGAASPAFHRAMKGFAKTKGRSRTGISSRGIRGLCAKGLWGFGGYAHKEDRDYDLEAFYKGFQTAREEGSSQSLFSC